MKHTIAVMVLIAAVRVLTVYFVLLALHYKVQNAASFVSIP